MQLNAAQLSAVTASDDPLLVIAGAGSGKTNTLAHRVAHLLANGGDCERLLLLTFSRRAAQEMTRRASRLMTQSKRLTWAGTFHGIANRVLRLHGQSIGLDPSFTVLDRSDSEDLLDVVRHKQQLSSKEKRFPKKGTCLAIYSRVVNSQEPLEQTLRDWFPWCEEWASELRALFGAYVAAKQSHHVLDYDDLLLYWSHLMAEPLLAAQVRTRFDYVLVDEYQDTNALQAQILLALKPDGRGLTVVGDDAQSIYSFRAARVRNILDFPDAFTPRARVVTLEENYRSTQPILTAANAVIELAEERFTKNLFSQKASGQKPYLVTVEDEAVQVDYVVSEILKQRERGVDLKKQAVLFRASHHSDPLEVELSRRKIPFVKFGGLKFLEAAHVKDALAVLRWAENPNDAIAAFRALQLLEGVGPVLAERYFATPDKIPEAMASLLQRLRTSDWAGQMGAVRTWYQPILERHYDNAAIRAADLVQLEAIASGYPSRERFLSEVTLDPPQAVGDEAGPPVLDEDYLILSTLHSAKGQEWDTVFVINASDGMIPSDLSTGHRDQIEEERRLFYVGLTRAKHTLHVVHPHKYFVRQQHKLGDRHIYAPKTRFIPDALLVHFEQRTISGARRVAESAVSTTAVIDVGKKLRNMWT